MKPKFGFVVDSFFIFVPATLAFRFLTPHNHSLIFVSAALAIIPLARWLGRATESLADRAGAAAGGLLNATFGNAAELIIAVSALRAGLPGVVKASLTGSIIGNILLVLGVAFTAGGVRHPTQKFNGRGARSQATLLNLAAVALIAPAAFHALEVVPNRLKEIRLSLVIAVILLITYFLGLLFSLKTHKHYFTRPASGEEEISRAGHAPWKTRTALLVLATSTAMVALMSEILVGSIEGAASALGMTDVFVGVIVVAVIGNAAEHSTSVMAAVADRMDLAISIALGSSTQIALFVAPMLVFTSLFVGRPMNLVFTVPEVLAVVIAVAASAQVTGDGESNWLEGVQLLSIYAILALVFYLLP